MQGGQGADRRREFRYPILESFNMFVVLPQKGFYRLRILGINTYGIGFSYMPLSEIEENNKPTASEQLKLDFYLNETLHLPLEIRVVHYFFNENLKKIGAEFINTDSESFKTLRALVNFIDQIENYLKLNKR